ncbi:hypothetical protein HTZ77_29730 [Nonomuraea sp. SMC257]|uniref:Uncharacterized protein n=1 Tax=Nonomuraea montanisoli TaxID=2741721 RepID=A0A7Y6M6G7_9ACTN|nr:hypothetical protein [Nonomuraea montanisoli]NUW35581.1 hypothetical protein [Nonomuraea montanisoli]
MTTLHRLSGLPVLPQDRAVVALMWTVRVSGGHRSEDGANPFLFGPATTFHRVRLA